MEDPGYNVSPCDRLQASICGQEDVLSGISDGQSHKSEISWSEFDSTESIHVSDIVKMEEGVTCENTDRHEKMLKQNTEVLLIPPIELFKFLKRPNEPRESYQWQPHLQELMRGKDDRLDRHSHLNDKSRRTRLKNLLKDEHAQSTCFWVTLFIMLSITVVILTVFSLTSTRNIFYRYTPRKMNGGTN